MIRVLYALRSNYEIFRDQYPNLPTNLINAPEKFHQWAFGFAPGVDYGRAKYFNMYDVFLWTMKHAGVL